jgi:hypothetical protein
MTGKSVVGPGRQKRRVHPIRDVLVSERAGVDGLQNDSVSSPGPFTLDPEGTAVSVRFIPCGTFAESFDAQDSDGVSKDPAQVVLPSLRVEGFPRDAGIYVLRHGLLSMRVKIASTAVIAVKTRNATHVGVSMVRTPYLFSRFGFGWSKKDAAAPWERLGR